MGIENDEVRMVRAGLALNDEGMRKTGWRLISSFDVRFSVFPLPLPLILDRIHIRPLSIDDASIQALSITDSPHPENG